MSFENKRDSKKHDKLEYEERVKIETLIDQGYSNGKIAVLLGRSKSTITREINHNKGGPERRHYRAKFAQFQSQLRRYVATKMNPSKDSKIWDYVDEKIKLGWSPEIISGRIKIDLPGYSISHECIYQHIYDNPLELCSYLPSRRPYRRAKGPRRIKKSKIPNRLSILERPEQIEQRTEIGHWESDSIISRKSKFGLNVMVERKTRFIHVTQITDLTAAMTQQAITSRLATLAPEWCKSITYDNGGENSGHEQTNQKLGTKSYFCEPYHSWEKGSVEQVNMLIRRYVPKGTDLAKLTKEQIHFIETQLNNRPRKCLDYQTPQEAFNSFS